MKCLVGFALAVMLVFLGCAGNVPCREMKSFPFHYSGVWQRGHDVTEPKPVVGEMMVVRDGGGWNRSECRAGAARPTNN